MQCCQYTAGQLRHSVTLQDLTTTTDAYGGRVKTWTDTATVKAKIQPLSGSELYAAMRLDSRITHKVVIRYVPGINPIQRIKFGDRILNINAVINVEERNRWLEIMCTEGSEI